MKTYPVQMGLKQGAIMIAQIDDETGQEHIITISPDQVEQIITGLRVAVDVLKSHQENHGK
jgi:hypothetical protein